MARGGRRCRPIRAHRGPRSLRWPSTFAGPLAKRDITASAAHGLWVDRERALVGAWYELFPQRGRTGGAAKRLPAVAAMGFDVVYLPPSAPSG